MQVRSYLRHLVLTKTLIHVGKAHAHHLVRHTHIIIALARSCFLCIWRGLLLLGPWIHAYTNPLIFWALVIQSRFSFWVHLCLVKIHVHLHKSLQENHDLRSTVDVGQMLTFWSTSWPKSTTFPKSFSSHLSLIYFKDKIIPPYTILSHSLTKINMLCVSWLFIHKPFHNPSHYMFILGHLKILVMFIFKASLSELPLVPLNHLHYKHKPFYEQLLTNSIY